ncbi:MAG: FecR domain-containing protein [Bacteroidetes bacterium]|nr:FecR domain-containing protein [Bacteroidota bacterium]
MKEENNKKLHQWLNEPGDSGKPETSNGDRLKSFLSEASKLDVPAKRSKQDIWNALESRMEPTAKTRRLYHPVVWGIAASISILLAVYFIFISPKPLIIENDWGKISTIELPDKSVVKLNAGSKLIYYPDEWDKTRSLELQGEALFQVENGSTFKVLTELGKVQVLGTVFNVYAREKKFTVACQSGLVSVTNLDGDLSREIGAGQLAIMEKNQIQVTKIANPIRIGSWQNGDFYFSRTPLSEVFGELERQFNVTIEFDTSQKTTYTGYFSNKDLDKALTNVCTPLGLAYSFKQKKGKVIIKQGGQR